LAKITLSLKSDFCQQKSDFCQQKSDFCQQKSDFCQQKSDFWIHKGAEILEIAVPKTGKTG
jgi:hypothetical protein